MCLRDARVEGCVAPGGRCQHLAAFRGGLAGRPPPAGGGARAEPRCGGRCDAPEGQAAARCRTPSKAQTRRRLLWPLGESWVMLDRLRPRTDPRVLRDGESGRAS